MFIRAIEINLCDSSVAKVRPIFFINKASKMFLKTLKAVKDSLNEEKLINACLYIFVRIHFHRNHTILFI